MRNYPAPQNPKEFQRKLDALGGRDLTGHTRFRVSWCMELKAWSRGMMRVKYPEGYVQEKEYEHGIRETGEYGEEVIRPATVKEWQAAKDAKNNTAVHRLKHWHVEFIGKPQWVVEEYTPPSEMLNESPENWERHRYRYRTEKEHLDELWVPMEYIPHLQMWREDVNGPFPSDGIYQDMIFLDKLSERSLELVKMGMRARDAVKAQDALLKHQAVFNDYYDPHKIALEEDELERAMREVYQDYKHIDFPHLYPRVGLYNPKGR